MIEELFRKHIQHRTLNLYPTTSSSTAEKSTADLQQQLYLNMKSKPQDQAADPELWEILKAKFEKVDYYRRFIVGRIGLPFTKDSFRHGFPPSGGSAFL
ncbi:hypothetical protein Tco_0212075 [Tanacetum coccineum]